MVKRTGDLLLFIAFPPKGRGGRPLPVVLAC
jgi:hypothetical protein